MITATLLQLPTQPPSGLAQAVALNEAIKRINTAAFKVNIMALNAIILARRAGSSARGFGVLSDELRGFTRALEGAMTNLRKLTWDIVSGVTLTVKQVRVQAVLARCTAGGEHCVKHIADPIARLSAAAATERVRLARSRAVLLQAIEEADRIGLMGNVLARTAKIEATYGQAFRERLADVSTDFDVAIGAILDSLADLKKKHARP